MTLAHPSGNYQMIVHVSYCCGVDWSGVDISVGAAIDPLIAPTCASDPHDVAARAVSSSRPDWWDPSRSYRVKFSHAPTSIRHSGCECTSAVVSIRDHPDDTGPRDFLAQSSAESLHWRNWLRPSATRVDHHRPVDTSPWGKRTRGRGPCRWGVVSYPNSKYEGASKSVSDPQLRPILDGRPIMIEHSSRQYHRY